MGTMALATVGEEGTRIHTDTRELCICILHSSSVFWTLAASIGLLSTLPTLVYQILRSTTSLRVLLQELYISLINVVRSLSD